MRSSIRMTRDAIHRTPYIDSLIFAVSGTRSNLSEKRFKSLREQYLGAVLGLIHFALIRQKGAAHPHQVAISEMDKWIRIARMAIYNKNHWVTHQKCHERFRETLVLFTIPKTNY